VKVKVARTAGFCMGVRKALEAVLAATTEASATKETVYTYGPLIHNNQVLEVLEARGVRCLEELDGTDSGRIAIRAHGIPPQERRIIKEKGLKILDATCPRVAKVQGIIKKHALRGYEVVIVGDDNHAEVLGLKGFSNNRAHVVSKMEDVQTLPPMERVLVVAQTTQDEAIFNEIVEVLQKRFPEVIVRNTICDSTHNRQQEVRSLSKEVEAMVVVGGRHSANTRRLADIAMASGVPTFHVETADELDRKKLSAFRVVGVTAGASTPNWLISRVVRQLETIEPETAHPLPRILRRFFRFLMESNLYVAGGACCLGYATAVLEGVKPRGLAAAITFLYVFAMHVLNRYTDRAAHLNDPARAGFYERHLIPFAVAGIVSVLLAVGCAALMGLEVLFALVVMIALGLLYSIRIVPEIWLSAVRVSKLKDIPASKTVFVAGAWSAVIALLPKLYGGLHVRLSTICLLLVVFVLVFVRSAIFDLVDIQGDRFVGEETVPVVIGEKRTIKLLLHLILLMAILLTVVPLYGLFTFFSYLMLASCAYAIFCVYTYNRKLMRPDSLAFEALVESNFYFAGILALLYQVLAARL